MKKLMSVLKVFGVIAKYAAVAIVVLETLVVLWNNLKAKFPDLEKEDTVKTEDILHTEIVS